MKRNMKMMLVAVFAMGLLFAATGIKALAEEGAKADAPQVQVIPKTEHEKMYPAGHPEAKTSKGLKCTYDEGKAAYLCPFDKPGAKEEDTHVHLVPREEHNKLFPAGHPDAATSKGLKCHYDEGKAAYLCPFDNPAAKTADTTMQVVPKTEHEKMYPAGHPEAKTSKGLKCHYDEGKAAYLCPFDKPATK